MSLIIPEGPFGAVLFDCDGTLADTMPLHYQAWTEELAPWGCPFEIELFYAWAGRPTQTIVELLNQKYGLQMPAQEILRSKEERFLKLLPLVKPIESVVSEVRAHFGQRPLAVVSGGMRVVIERTLESLGLTRFFDTVVTVEDYAQGKPAPDCFLLAAERVGVPPSECLVFEDADLGIEAAQAAGMQWVRV